MRQNLLETTMARIVIVNGPNLNLLGKREPGIYGGESFEDYMPVLRRAFKGVDLELYQSNCEGELIDKIQKEGFSADGIALNAGAYTHTSIALYDCIRAVPCPVVEVHISNVHAREEFRRRSAIAPACCGVVAGFGLHSYKLAVEALLEKTGWKAE